MAVYEWMEPVAPHVVWTEYTAVGDVKVVGGRAETDSKVMGMFLENHYYRKVKETDATADTAPMTTTPRRGRPKKED